MSQPQKSLPRTRSSRKRTIVVLAASSWIFAINAPALAVAGEQNTGRTNTITDVAGIEVGHYTDRANITGTSVLLMRGGAQVGVDVRGGAPGTVNTDALNPVTTQAHFHGLFLSGGSWMGLGAYDGVMQYLREQKVGHIYAEGKVVPGVAGAIIYDLGQGEDFACPLETTPERTFGYQAARVANTETVAQGSSGGGTGAGTGGPGIRLKGGMGSASVDLGNGIVVGAFVVVNSSGKAYDETRGCELYGLHLELGDEFGATRPPNGCPAATPNTPAQPGIDENTTIGVVATNATLTSPETQKMSQVAQDGLARAIRPAHTMSDGDTIFAVSTRKAPAVSPDDFNRILEAGANAFSRAVVHAVLKAEPLGGRPTYCQTFPGACGTAPATAHGHSPRAGAGR